MVKKLKIKSEIIVTIISEDKITEEEKGILISDIERYLNEESTFDVSIGRKEFISHLRFHVKGYEDEDNKKD